MSSPFTESIIEQAAIDGLKDLGYSYVFGLEMAFNSYVITLVRLRDKLLPMLLRDGVMVVLRDVEKQL